jgi:DNA-binding LacI/PurR family transcriptional regulator
MRQITLIDIAIKAGVAASTVSRALNNKPDVNEKTREQIKKIAKKYNFRLNPIAQGLKNNSTKIIGVIVPEIKHDFFSSVISGIEEVTYTAGYNILVCQSNESSEREIINTDLLVQQRVAGILVSIAQNTKNGDHFKDVLNNNIPVVFFDRVCREVDAGKVVIDDEESAFEAVSYLIRKGYKNIAHLAGPKSLNICKKRLLGYKTALKKNGIPLNRELIRFGGLHEPDGYASMDILMKGNLIPDAVFAVNDPVAVGAYQKIKEAGLRIPADIAVVGFSNNTISSLIEPQMTTVNQPSFEIGKKAAEMLIGQIENKKERTAETVVIKANLIIRNST